MSLTKSSTRIGLFALLLTVIVLSLFGSLVAADRALSATDAESARLDAHGSALAIEREIRFRSEALGQVFGPLLPGAPTTRRAVSPAAPSPTTPAGFDALWLLDTHGVIAWSGADSAAARVDSALIRGAARRVSAGDSPAIRAGGDGLVLVAVPLMHRGEALGVAVGAVRGVRLLETLRDPAVERPWLSLSVDGNPVATVGRRDRFRSYLAANAPIHVAGDPLAIELAHPRSGRSLRLTLWFLGALGFLALLVALARERRQTFQLAGRTTELERLYQEVARSNKMKSEFLANVSHELRTPLNAVVGFVEMLREGVYGELTPRQALPVDRIAASATHLRHLVDRLLDIAKIAAGRVEVHAEPLVLRPFVLNVASEMESLVSERGLALSIAVSPSLPRIRTDQTHLRQILINLIGNAVKYTPTGGIQVRARLVGNDNGGVPDDASDASAEAGPPPDPERRWVALQVSDTGIGIAAADRERIFDEFEQVNAGARTDSVQRGTGLGLAISRRLARLIGGELTVTSEFASGSIFTVWLPVDTPSAPPA